jgi:phage terminase large subunit-like protein
MNPIIIYPRELLAVNDRPQFNPAAPLLPYQRDWFNLSLGSDSLLVCTKSRRIGLSWCDSAIAVTKAINLGISTYYTSYNYEAGLQYIKDCTLWYHYYKSVLAESQISFELLDDVDDRGLLKSKIRFSNGASINVLPANAINIRGKQGDVVIDEAAFRELGEYLEAATALSIWGGQLRIISTHYGIGSDFNQQALRILNNDVSGGYLEIPFKGAVSNGLYNRICQKANRVWNLESEREWLESVYKSYGSKASQELDVIPSEDNIENGLFYKSMFSFVDLPEIDTRSLILIRAWDNATTDKQDAKLGHFYTAGVLIGFNPILKKLCILDVKARQLSPLKGDQFMLETAIADGERVQIVIESEPGSGTKKWEPYLRDKLAGFKMRFVRPQGSKLSRAVPFAAALESGKLQLIKAKWNDMYVENLIKFDGLKAKPLINDLVDSTSLGFNFLQPVTNSLLG